MHRPHRKAKCLSDRLRIREKDVELLHGHLDPTILRLGGIEDLDRAGGLVHVDDRTGITVLTQG